MAEAKTGSVGQSTAPTRNEAIQGKPATQCAKIAVARSVSGSPKSKARPGKCQARKRSRAPTRMPSVKSTLKSASSASRETTGTLRREGEEAEDVASAHETRHEEEHRGRKHTPMRQIG